MSREKLSPMHTIKVGKRLVITKVWHPTMNDRLGKRVVVARVDVDERVAWVFDDKPVSFRINRAGNKEVIDPRCIQVLYSFSCLSPWIEGEHHDESHL